MFKRFFAKACCTRGRPQIVHFGRRAPCRAVLSGSDGCGGGTDVKLDDFNTQLTRTSTYPTFSTAGLSALKAALDARVKELVWGPVVRGRVRPAEGVRGVPGTDADACGVARARREVSHLRRR